LLFTNQQVYDAEIVDAAVDAIAAAVESGRLSEARIDESVARVGSLFAAVGD
jgi:beta-N-acetylhexosaminidase